MIFTKTALAGVWVIDLERREDERGYFARTFCFDEFGQRGLIDNFVQSNASFNRRAGTLRGMHFQAEPYPEVKLVRCTRGAIFDVAVDLRPESPTFRKWFGVELTEDNARSIYVPAGCAHGFQTLVPDSEVLYMMGETYRQDLARGVRWNDSAFNIHWPLADPVMSERDATYPDYTG